MHHVTTITDVACRLVLPRYSPIQAQGIALDTFGQASHNANSNYQEAFDFLNVLSTIEPNMLWELGRMSFWWHSAYADKSEAFFRDNARIWRNQNGEIVALCISEYG